jgi:hypothetical protein
MRSMRRILIVVGMLVAVEAPAQHDISKVEPAPEGGIIAVPVPEGDKRRMKKYDVVDLGGAQQAIGSQLIDGRLPKPLIDFVSNDGKVEQRVSLFEGGLVVVKMTGAATLRKKVVIPADALKAYLAAATPASLRQIDTTFLAAPSQGRSARLRVYEEDGSYVERFFNPSGIVPKPLHDKILPLQDLLRAITEDRGVTSSVSNYMPKEGDELVADDQRIFRVMRLAEPDIVELKCISDPTTMYVSKKDLAQHFIGARPR